MSDFDKEAEREKLREKYGKEEERREATEQMSELLLQGATMTNAHCSDCGDPIFRYDGTEFCPTCEKRVDRDTGEGDAAATGEGDAAGEGDATDEAGDSGVADAGEANADDGSADESAPDPRTVEVTSPSDDARVTFGGPNDAEARDAAESADHAGEAVADGTTADATPNGPDATDPGADESADERREPPADPSASGGTGAHPSDAAAPAGSDGTAASPERSPGAREDPTADRVPSLRPESGDAGGASADGVAATPAEGDVAASESLQRARRTLAATVERFSRRALETDSPREAREYLETAREAAATLDATEF